MLFHPFIRQAVPFFQKIVVPSIPGSSSLGLLDPEIDFIMILQKVRNYLPDVKASHHRRLKSSGTLL